MVKAFVAVAVTVTVPPRLTVEPLIVIELLVKPALGIVVEAVMADAPLPYMYPVKPDAPVPPLAVFNVPPRVMLPVVAVLGVSPVLPALKELTPPKRLNWPQPLLE